jgi:hypothetical protein
MAPRLLDRWRDGNSGQFLPVGFIPVPKWQQDDDWTTKRRMGIGGHFTVGRSHNPPSLDSGLGKYVRAGEKLDQETPRERRSLAV